MSELSVRALSENNLAKSADIIRKGFSTAAKAFNLTAQNCPSNGAFIKDGTVIDTYKQGVPMFGLFLGETQIGFVQLSCQNQREVELEKLTVLPEYRHLGGGKLLLDFACNHAKQMGYKIVNIGIIEENKQLKRWYLAYGFAHNGVKNFASLPFTVGFMSYQL